MPGKPNTENVKEFNFMSVRSTAEGHKVVILIATYSRNIAVLKFPAQRIMQIVIKYPAKPLGSIVFSQISLIPL